MLKSICHDQVKLLLERMDSNPEEFLHHHKWNPFLPDMHHIVKGTADYFRAFNIVERALIARKFNKLCQRAMRVQAYNRILEVAIAGEREVKENNWTAPSYTINNTANTTSVLTIGTQTLTEADIKKMKKKTIWRILL